MTQRALFPMKYLDVTRGMGVGSHAGTKAIDLAGKDAAIDNVYAPFSGVIKKIYNNGNSVWLESLAPVLRADGTTGYLVFMATHDNNVSNLYVGQKIAQGTPFYQEGTAGNATGNHVHVEVGSGKFVDPGWHQNSLGTWTINSPRSPHTSLWLNPDTIVIASGGYAWKRIKEEEGFVIEEQPPVFKASYYLANTPDLKKAKYTLAKAKAHWLKYGIKEGRPSAPNFHVKEYLANYADLRKVYGAKGYAKALRHYFNHGINEGRSGRLLK